MSILSAVDITKSLSLPRANETFTVGPLSIQIGKRTITAMTGRSGSGKTTVLQMLGLLSKPDSGSLSILDKKLSAIKGSDVVEARSQHIGFVFQSFNLIPQLNALKNIAIASTERPAVGLKRASELLATVGLADRANNMPSELSAGEQQRVAFCRSIVNSPELLLADEPTGNLDSANEKLLLKQFRNYADIGNAVVIVTHSAEVANFADRTLHIENGQLIETSDVAASSVEIS